MKMTSIRPFNVRPLLLEDIPKLGLSDEILENIGLVDYEDDNQLNRSDYIIGDIIFDDLLYTIVHGFPGDNVFIFVSGYTIINTFKNQSIWIDF